jgi:hypothetical protein
MINCVFFRIVADTIAELWTNTGSYVKKPENAAEYDEELKERRLLERDNRESEYERCRFTYRNNR